MHNNNEQSNATFTDYDDVFVLASEAIARLRLGDDIPASDGEMSIAEFIDTAIPGELLWRCCDETAHVTEMVTMWEDELADTAPHLLGHTEALIALAVELGAVRELFFWEDINSELAELSVDGLTTGLDELDAWFYTYAMSQFGRGVQDQLDDDESCDDVEVSIGTTISWGWQRDRRSNIHPDADAATTVSGLDGLGEASTDGVS